MFNPIGWLKVQRAHAHCDIPCGIYDPISAKIAAQTVQKMVLRIQALERPDGSDAAAMQDYVNKIARYVTVKDEHAEICKRELAILWADYAWP
ncbi:MAG: superoxide dismutase, Ni, partial [Chloroflexi bacterium]|nr:superoxide dismutase, Ni [Chloroflexota bacterium]